jgi:hypothetical protein
MIETPVIDLSTIPTAQPAVVLALMEKVVALTEITQRQEHLIAELNHALHGKRSEKLTEDERQLAFEDLSIALAEVEVQKEHLAAKAGDKTATRPAPKRTIGNLPAALPRIEEVIEPESLICPCGCGVMHKIGEDRSERLDIVPAQLRVIVTVRPKYACRTCTDGVTQAPAPAHLIMGGLPTEASIAHVPPLGRFGFAKSPAVQRSANMRTTFHYTAKARFWRGLALICTALCWPIGWVRQHSTLSPSSTGWLNT